jgi:hypothetical protein
MADAPTTDPMERFKTLHFWLIFAGAVLGGVGLSGVIPLGTPWQKLIMSIAGAIGTLGGAMASLWQPMRVKAALEQMSPTPPAPSPEVKP